MAKVGRKGVITLEEARSVDNNLVVVEGMQFERGYISPYFVTDSERMTCSHDNCKLLLVDKKVKSARDMIIILEEAIKQGFPLLIIAEDIEQEALATLVVNKLRGALKTAPSRRPASASASRVPGGHRDSTGATVVKDEPRRPWTRLAPRCSATRARRARQGELHDRG